MNHRFTNPIPSSLFSYNSKTRTFSTEASELYGYDILQRVHEDPCSRGFSMKSTKTGVEVPFYFTSKLQNLEEYDGELQGWKFVCGHDDNPNGEHYVCLIFND